MQPAWTKAHSQRAIAAKARLRQQRAEFVGEREEIAVAPLPHRVPAKWRINIRDGEHGDRLQISLHRSPFRGQWLTAEGLRSSTAIARAIGVLIREAA